MRIAILGCGHVGLVTGVTLAKVGHDVVGYDPDAGKVEALKAGKAPFFEPGLQVLLDEVVASGSIAFNGEPSEAVPGAEVVFTCVGTPVRPDGDANLVMLETAATDIGRYADRDMVVVQKSTVPVQTADKLRTVLKRTSERTFHIVSNPEFLSEGHAVRDSLEPVRILVGADSEEGHRAMRAVYAPFIEAGVIYHATDIATAELAKHACNAFLALKISYANALARICEATGADVVTVADIMGSDPRIGRDFLDAGLGYGGYCFPKDIAAFRFQADRLGYDFGILDEIVRINNEAVDTAFSKVQEALWNLEDKRVALFGLAFKPGTDDVREAPALKLARRLIEAGAVVVGYDPQANRNAVDMLPELPVTDDPYEAAEGAHAVVICTEWPEFADIDLPRLKGILTHPVIVDARNLLDPQAVADAGFTYIPTGRPPINQ